MAPIRNVTMVGAAGVLGAGVLDRLLASGAFTVTVLRRHGSSSKLPAGVRVVDVDMDSPEELKAALTGQDALVSTIGAAGLGLQRQLADAAAAAGVRRFIPSEFGCDTGNALAREIPVFGPKISVAQHLAAKARETPMTYTLVSCGPFLDYCIEKGFLIAAPEAGPPATSLWDGGEAVFSATTLPSVGDAVVAVLKHADETANRRVYVEDIKTSQRQLLALARRAAPDRAWPTQEASIDEAVARADKRLAAGNVDVETYMAYLVRAIFDPAYGTSFAKTDNQLLGLAGKTEADVVRLISDILERQAGPAKTG